MAGICDTVFHQSHCKMMLLMLNQRTKKVLVIVVVIVVVINVIIITIIRAPSNTIILQCEHVMCWLPGCIFG